MRKAIGKFVPSAPFCDVALPPWMPRIALRIVLGVLVLLLGGCAPPELQRGGIEPAVRRPAVPRMQAPASVATPRSEKTIPFIDAHVHLNDVAMQIELMAANGISRAVVFWGRSGDNASIRRAARAHPDKFIAFASVSPERSRYRALWSRQDPQLLVELDELLQQGDFRGIGEISIAHFPAAGFAETDFSLASPLMSGIMELARRYRVPVLIHCEITRLNEVAMLLHDYPDVSVIWAHGGYTPYFVARRMLDAHPNLFYELAARTWRRHPRSPEYTIFKTDDEVWPQWLRLIETHPTRFLVGTDASHRSRTADQMKIESVHAFLRQLTPSTQYAVAQGNLLRLVGSQ